MPRRSQSEAWVVSNDFERPAKKKNPLIIIAGARRSITITTTTTTTEKISFRIEDFFSGRGGWQPPCLWSEPGVGTKLRQKKGPLPGAPIRVIKTSLSTTPFRCGPGRMIIRPYNTIPVLRRTTIPIPVRAKNLSPFFLKFRRRGSCRSAGGRLGGLLSARPS